MAARKNYFEILQLMVDPPEGRKRKIEEAIESWKKRLEDRIGGESRPLEQSRLKAELNLEKDMRDVMLTPAKRNQEAVDYRDELIKSVEATAAVQKEGGLTQITKTQVREISKTLRLSEETIRKTYLKQGFDVIEPINTALLDQYFLTQNREKEYTEGFKTLLLFYNQDTQQQQFYDWVAKVKDFYSLACYFSGSKDVDAYKRKSTQELKAIMAAGNQKFVVAAANDLLRQLAKMFSLGELLFTSQEDRDKYDRTIRTNQHLGELFDQIRKTPEIIRKSAAFAEPAILKIQSEVSDATLALALYNRVSGVGYQPAEVKVTITCASCRTVNTFNTQEEAEKASCTTCGASLFQKCPNPRCQKIIPRITEVCPGCHFNLREMGKYDLYLQLAERAFDSMDISTADVQILKAEHAWPGRAETAALKRRIDAVGTAFRKELESLNKLISQSQLWSANQKLRELGTKYPSLKIDSVRKQVDDGLKKANTSMPKAGVPVWDAANQCELILQTQVSDYRPALDFLHANPPREPQNPQCIIQGEKVLVRWTGAGDRGVSYRIERKSQPETGSKILVSDLKNLQYLDEQIQPGVTYTYELYAVRREVSSSKPAVCTVAYYSELDERRIRKSSEDGMCTCSWTLPLNCIGVRVLRAEGVQPALSPSNETRLISASSRESFTDTNVRNGKTYLYRLQCIYLSGNGNHYTSGIVLEMAPQPRPEAVRDVCAGVNNGRAEVNWSDSGRDQMIEVWQVDSDYFDSRQGRTFEESQLTGKLGNLYGKAPCRSTRISFEIPKNTALHLAVLSKSGSWYMVCGVLDVSSIQSVEIDRDQTYMVSGKLRLCLKDLPRGLVRIHYLCCKGANGSTAYCSADDAKNGRMQTITPQEYEENGMILFENPPQDILYLTVVGEYRNSIFSAPSRMPFRNYPKEVIEYRLKWQQTGLFSKKRKKEGCRLLISCSASYTPQMELTVCTNGAIPMDRNHPGNTVIFTVPEMEDGFPQKQYEAVLPAEIWRGLEGCQARLLLTKQALTVYNVKIQDLDSLKITFK